MVSLPIIIMVTGEMIDPIILSRCFGTSTNECTLSVISTGGKDVSETND